MKKLLVLVATLSISIAGISEGPSAEPESRPVSHNRIMIHMKHYTDDLHVAFMALELADRLQSRGAELTFLFDLEGARFADGQSSSAGIRGPGRRSFSEVFDDFVKRGGHSLVCQHCAEHSGIKKLQVRKGIEFADLDAIATAVIAADKIIEY